MGYSIGRKVSEQLKRIEVNDYGDFIMLNPGDASFSRRFSELLQWIEQKDAQLSEKAAEMEEKYKGTPMIHTSEEGDTEIDTEQFSLFVKIKTEFYKECEQRIDALFGQDTLKKYFRAFYEANPEFVPDEECIMDFLQEIGPVLESIYNERFQRINAKYSKNRNGGKRG